MIIKKHHSWDLKYRQAVLLQEDLVKKLLLQDCFGRVRRIAGVDVKYIKQSDMLIAAVLIFSYPEMHLIETNTSSLKSSCPYIPGLLVLREGPVIEECFKNVANVPDLVFFDGHGYSHPRRLGLASHMGLLLDLPSIGCAKSNLCGDYEEPDKKEGSFSFIFHNNEMIGAAVRTMENTKPVFLSAGHKISLKTAVKYALRVSRFRIPEPTRLAHNYLNKLLTGVDCNISYI
jgi:deoxyribonuclease V